MATRFRCLNSANAVIFDLTAGNEDQLRQMVSAMLPLMTTQLNKDAETAIADVAKTTVTIKVTAT